MEDVLERWAGVHTLGEEEELLRRASKYTGLKQETLSRARYDVKKTLGKKKLNIILTLARLIEYLENLKINRKKVSKKLLMECTQKGVKLSGRRLEDYFWEIFNCRDYCKEGGGYDGNYRKDVYMDAPIGLGLIYINKPNAITSFIPLDEKTLMIRQLQGLPTGWIDYDQRFKAKWIRNGHSRGLFPLDWQKLLIIKVSELAKEFGFTEIGIRSGYNLDWVKRKKLGNICFELEDALKKYDWVAERLGFEQMEDKNWYASSDISSWRRQET